jgi:uncharacterized ion transporter superfamily protein YfcC
MPLDLKKIKVPNTLIIVFSVAILTTVMTWIIPGGEYDYIEKDNRQVAVPGSFHYVDRVPQGIGALLTAPLKGINEVSYIIGFVLVIGGVFSIIAKTGAINAAIHAIARAHVRKPGRDKILIPLVMILFSLAGATFGMSEEVIPFVLIFIPLARNLGYDSITGVAMCYVAAHIGFAAAFINPFTLGIAQGIAELPSLSGIEYRIFVWIAITMFAILFVMRYAVRIKNNPEMSPVYVLDREYWSDDTTPDIESEKMTAPQKAVLFLFGGTMIGLIYGVMRYEWYVTEIGGLFLGLGIASAFIGRIKLNDIAVSFINGAKDLVGPALIIGFARGILIIAQDGEIVDTILHWLSEAISIGHPVFSAHLMFVTQSCINFFIPSASGQAALTMPIMAPLSDLVGITRQTAVLAYQLGDGFTNMIVPTAPVLMGVLGLSKIPWEVWARWMLPYQVMLFILGLLILIPPVLFEWGPF